MPGTDLIGSAIREGRIALTEIEAKELLQEAGIAVTETRLASSADEAVSISEEIGYPVVLKIVSPDVVHKSDAGGVRLDLGDADQVAAAYDEILASVREKHPDAAIQGISVQAMARRGVEVIIGMYTDPQFGPVVMFGLGGIMVEILKDVSFRIVPLEPRDAREMIREIKGYPVLQGYRGQAAVDIAGLEKMLLKVSAFIEKHPEVRELDLNPVLAYSDGAVAVDARIMLGETE